MLTLRASLEASLESLAKRGLMSPAAYTLRSRDPDLEESREAHETRDLLKVSS